MKISVSRKGAWNIQCVNSADLDAVTHLTDLNYPLHPRDRGEWDRPFPEEVTPIHGGDRANVFKVEIAGGIYCAKVFHDKRFHVRIRNRVGLSKAQRAFDNGLRLEALKVPVPKTIALLCSHNLQILVTEFVGEGEALRTKMMRDSSVSEVLLTACSAFTHDLAAKGVYHVDYGARNILLDGSRLLLIDLEDVSFPRKKSAVIERELRREFISRMKRNSLKSVGF